MASFDFKGKVVLVTGASSGIGADTARYFSKLGATLVLTGRNFENLKRVAEDCRGGPFLVQGDVSREDDVQKIIDETISKFKRLDVLINNAGTFIGGSIKNSTLEQFDQVMNVNLRAVYHLTSLAVPHLVATRGNIVNISSVMGMRSFNNCLSYSISKAGLDQLTKCTALELASDGVRVNSVNPGLTVTSLLDRVMPSEAVEAYYESSKSAVPMRRVGYGKDVVGTIAFLASNLASYITGACVPIDGGRHVTCTPALLSLNK